jgi:hypothetical protein
MAMFPQLNEPQRLQYMQALGVTSWLPRQALAGSQNNTVLWQHEDEHTAAAALESIATPASFEQNVEELQRSVESQAQAVAVALGGLATAARVAPVSAQVLPTEDGIAASHEPVNVAPMHLALSWYATGVLVINDVPVQEGAAMSSPIQGLQTSIVNALVSGGSQTMPSATVEFNWPLVPGPHGDHSLAGAKSGLTYSLIKLLQDKTCHQLLAMGPAAAQLLQPKLELGQASKFDIGSLSMTLVYSHSLHQLLAVPSLKAETWAHLRPLLASE